MQELCYKVRYIYTLENEHKSGFAGLQMDPYMLEENNINNSRMLVFSFNIYQLKSKAYLISKEKAFDSDS